MDGLLYAYGFGDRVSLPENTLDSVSSIDTLSYESFDENNSMQLYIHRDIIARTKVANRVTQDLVKKYHAHFTELFNSAKQHIETLEDKIYSLENPSLRCIENLKAVEFNPEPITVSEDIKNYIMEAMSKCLDLRDVLPPDFDLSI